MRVLPLLLLLCVLSVAPAYGQPVTPVPPNATTFISEVAETTQALGILTVVVLVVLGVLAVIVLIVLEVAWKGLSPLLATIKTLNDARDELQEQLFSRLEKGDTERATTAAINRETVIELKARETKAEAQTRSNGAITAVNAFTAGAHDATRNQIDAEGTETRKMFKEVAQQVDEALKITEKVQHANDERFSIYDTKFNELLLNVQIELTKLSRLLKTGTGELNPDAVPDTDPALAAHTERHADVAPEPPDIWQGDTPDNV